MLQVKITNSAGVAKTYDEELISFTWSTRNNEGTSFSASIPKVNASLTLCVVDDFIATVDRRAKVEISSTEGDGLVLPLSIIEVTPLKKKGETEISCTGNFFEDTNSIFGTLEIPAADFEVTKEDYGLDMVEMPEANNAVTVNVSKKEDIALGIAWGFNTRRNISVTPFTTGDGSFSRDGIGIFKNMKEVVNDRHAPVYRISADQIVDYNIEAAQPPVTHIQTTKLGELGPTPQIPATVLTKYSDFPTDNSVDLSEYKASIDNNVRAFYVEESQVAAVWHVSENRDETIAAQTLDWSDGTQTVWDSTAPRQQVIGIFDNAFVRIKNATAIEIVDREDVENVLKTVTVDDTSTLWVSHPRDYFQCGKTNALAPTDNYSNMSDVQVLWFRHITPAGYIGIWYDGTNAGTLKDNSATYTAGRHYFVASNKVKPDTNETQDHYYAQALFVSSLEQGSTDAIPRILFSVTRNAAGTISVSRQVLAVCVLGQGIGTARDAIINRKTVSASNPMYVTWNNLATSGTPVVVTEKLAGSTSTLEVQSLGGNNVHWLADIDTIGIDYLSTPQLVLFANGEWNLLQENAAGNLVVLQRGSLFDWLSDETSLLAIQGRGVFAPLLYEGDYYWTVYLQMDALPFISRQQGSPMMSHRIAVGSNNVVALPFKVGALQQFDKNVWDKDKGRIEIELAEFSVRNNATGAWLVKSIQALNIIATTAYVKVQLDETEEEIDVKTTGFSISYNGVVTAKLSGIITE